MTHWAIYGAAFDPPTLGHADVIAQIHSQFDKVLLVPAYSHAFGKQMSPFETRLRWLAAFEKGLATLGLQAVTCPIESALYALAPNQPITTFQLLNSLQALVNAQVTSDNPVKLSFIIGPDNADPKTWQRFYRYREIDALFDKVVVEQRVPVRSTQVRDYLQACGQPDYETLCQLVLPEVASVLIQS